MSFTGKSFALSIVTFAEPTTPKPQFFYENETIVSLSPGSRLRSLRRGGPGVFCRSAIALPDDVVGGLLCLAGFHTGAISDRIGYACCAGGYHLSGVSKACSSGGSVLGLIFQAGVVFIPNHSADYQHDRQKHCDCFETPDGHSAIPWVQPCPFKCRRVKGSICNEWSNMMTVDVSRRLPHEAAGPARRVLLSSDQRQFYYGRKDTFQPTRRPVLARSRTA